MQNMNKILLKGLQFGDILVDVSECPVTGKRNGRIDVVTEINNEWDEARIKTVSEPDDFQNTKWLRFATMEDIQNSDYPWMTKFIFKREDSPALAFNFESLFIFAEKRLS